MEGCLDIYIKLVIAIISFIAPITVYLLSFNSDGIAIISRRSQEQQIQMKDLAIQNATLQTYDRKKITEANDKLEKMERALDRRINLLNPKRQIIRIFSSLLSALIFIMVYKINAEPNPYFNHQECSKWLLFLSLASFIGGVLILRQVAWAAINTKQEIAEDGAAETIGTN